MKRTPFSRLWRKSALYIISAFLGLTPMVAQDTISFFGEPDSAAPGSISDKVLGGDSFEIETVATSGTVTVAIIDVLPATRNASVVNPISIVDSDVFLSDDLNDSAVVTLEATLTVDEVIVEQITRTFTVRRPQNLSFIDLPEFVLGDSSFGVTVEVDPDEGQGLGFDVIDGPAAVDPVSGRVNVYGTGAILLQAYGDETNYDAGDPDGDLLEATTYTETLVVEGDEPDGDPGFLDQWTWQAPQLSSTEFLLDVAVNETQTQFVGVGASGFLVQGTDPTDVSTWTNPNSGVTDHLQGLTFGNGLYVAVGMNETVLSSADGLTWALTNTGIPADTDLYTVGFSNDTNEYYAVGTNGSGQAVLYTSANGTNWTNDPSFPSLPLVPNAIEYSDVLSTWQVVSESGSRYSGSVGSWMINSFGFQGDFNDLLTTEAGVTYVVGDSGTIERITGLTNSKTVYSGTNYDLLAIVKNDEYLVAIGEGGRILRSHADDGERWTESISPFRFDMMGAVFWDGLIMAVGQNNSVMTSGSGFDWTVRNSTTPNAVRGIASDGSITVAVGDNGTIYRSTNGGFSWTTVSVPAVASVDLRDVTYSPIGFLSVGTGGLIMYSADGENWTVTFATLFGGGFGGDFNAVTHNGAVYAAVGANQVAAYSADGMTWEVKTVGSHELYDVHYANGRFVAVGGSGTAVVSLDGESWTPKDTDVDNDLLGVTASQDEFLAVGADGAILSSPNGNIWTRRISSVTGDLESALYANDSFYAFGEGFSVLVSDVEGDWSSQTASTQNSLYDVAVVDDQFVAVGDNGSILTSPTAGSTGLEEWTFRYTGDLGTNINDVVYADNGFVAVGDNGQILISEDGQNWEEKSVVENDGSPLTENLLGVAYGAGRYLAVGGQKLISSTDAENWTVITTWTVDVNSVSFGNGLFVVTGEASSIFYSTNGTTWNGGSYNGIHGAATLRDSVFYDDFDIWIAVGDAANYQVSADETANMAQLFFSTDGQYWTRQESPEIQEDEYFEGNLLTVSAGDSEVWAFGEGRLTYNPFTETWRISALSSFTTYASLYSPGNGGGGYVYAGENGAISGIDPDFRSFPGITENLNGLAFGDQSYVAVGDDGRILYSEDAETWVLRTSENLGALRAVAVDSLGRYVTVGDGETILRSDNSISWEAPTTVPALQGENVNFHAVTTNDSGFVAIGQYGNILRSEDGDEWSRDSAPVLENLNGVASGGGNTVAVGQNGTILANAGASEWTVEDSGVTADLNAVHFQDGLFLAVGDGGTVLSSSDGISWTTETSGISSNLVSIGFGELTAGGYWSAVGEEGTIYISVDNGSSWSQKNSGTVEDLNAVAFGQENFLTVGAGGTVLSSNNSSEWLSRPVGTDYALNGVAYFNGVFTLVGDFQTILTSGRIEERTDQQIIFLSIGDKVVSDSPFAPQVIATSGLPVTLEIVSGPASVSGSDIVLDGTVGTVVVRATQSGSVQFNAATPVEVSFDVLLTTQTIDFFGESGSAAPGSVSEKQFGGGSFDVVATTDSGLTPTVTVESGPAVITEQTGGVATVSVTGAGSVTLTANQPGDGTYASAAEVVRTFTATQATQTIDFDAPATAGEADPPLTLVASATSGLPVTFAVTSGPASIQDGDQLVFSGNGIVVVEASQSGDDDYLPAASVSDTITVEAAETGDVWQSVSSGTTKDLYGIGFEGSSFFAVGDSLTVLQSADAQNWTLRANSSGILRDVAYGGIPAIYIAVGDGGIPFYSLDGETWLLLGASGLESLNAIEYAAGQFFAVGNGGAIWRSLNGETWSLIDTGVTSDLVDITYTNGSLVAVGGSTVLLSEDLGASWTVSSFPGDTVTLNAVAGDGEGEILVVGSAGQILFSPDSGSSWAVRPSPIESDLFALTYGTDRYIVAGAGGSIYSSTDSGASWKLRVSGTTETLNRATFRSEVFVIVGDAGTILTSGLSASKVAQTIDFPAISAPLVGTDVTLSATALSSGTPSDQEVQFALVEGTGVISSVALQPDGSTTATLTISGDPGDYVVRASLPVADNFLGVPGEEQSFTVVGESQNYENLFPSAGSLMYSASPIGLSATATDATSGDPTGIPVEFEVVSGDASISGSSLTLESGSVGSDVVIRIFNAGDATYSPLNETVTYTIAAETSDIVFKAIPDKLLSDPNFFVEAKTSNGADVGVQIVQGVGLVTVTSYDEDDGNGNLTYRHEVSIEGSDDSQGEVILEAYALPGSGVTADPVRQSFYISKYEQNINFVDPGPKTFGDAPFVINASADGGGEITFSLGDGTVASLDGSTVTILSAGTIQISAVADPSGDYGPASGQLSVTVSKASQTLEFDPIDDQFEGSVISIPLVARTFIGDSESEASSVDYPVIFTVVDGTDIASISGSTLTLNGAAGEVTVQATQAGNVNVFAADPVEQTFTVSNFGRAPVTTSLDFNGVAYGNNQYVAVGESGAIARSTDATVDVTQWDALIPSQPTRNLFDVVYGGDRFVAVGSGGTVQYSTNGGMTWSSGTSPTSSFLAKVEYGQGLFVAIESSVSGLLYTSSNGSSWSARGLPTSNRLTDLVLGVNSGGSPRFVAVGTFGTVLTSSNGISWSQQVLGTQSISLESVAYGDGLFVAITSSRTYIYSEDGGVTWYQNSIPESVTVDNPELSSIVYGNSSFRVVGSGGSVLTATPEAIRNPIDSSDGSSRWVREISLGSNDLNEVIFGGDRFVAVGDSGTILVSLPEVASLSLSDWIASYDFSGLTAGAVTGMDDPDGDSYSVALEYALGGDPVNPEATALTRMVNAGGQIMLCFNRRLVSDVSLEIQESSDMVSWNTIRTYDPNTGSWDVTEGIAETLDGTYVKVDFSVSISASTMFLRVTVP